jgi:citryl-CoA lyase
MLSIGKNHGGAGEAAAELLSSEASAAEIVEERKVIPGFGHKIYKDEDPRATAIYQKAKDLGFECTYFDKAYAVERALEEKKGKKIPLNIDGAQAAALLELGFDWRLGEAFFLMGRIVGMSAHVLEELEQKNSYHRLEESDIE